LYNIATLYVAPNGSSSNPGTNPNAPALFTSTFVSATAAGDTIVLLPGNYTISSGFGLVTHQLNLVGQQGSRNTIVSATSGVTFMTLNYPASGPAFSATGITFTVWTRIFSVNGGNGLILSDIAFIGISILY
jgi:hypothetical protein